MKIGLGILLFLALKVGVAWAEGSVAAPSSSLASAASDEACDPDYQALYRAIRSGETGVEMTPSAKQAIASSLADKSLVDATVSGPSSVGTGEGSAGSGR